MTRKLGSKKYVLDIERESDGTKALFYMIPYIFSKVEKGGLLLIDELDSHLHPKLTRELICIFNDQNNSKAQLVFTSHDILNMTNELFRRDEIWFVVKDDNLSSKLIALTDLKNYKGERVRKDAFYGKQYLEGRYGADPFITKGLYWDGKNT